MIKIAYIINSIRNNGPSNVLVNMVLSINCDEYKTTIITLINENDQVRVNRLRVQGVEVIELNMSKNLSTLLKTSELRRIVKDGGYDLIHTHSHIPAIMAQNIPCKKVSTVHNRLSEDFINSYGKIKGRLLNYFYIDALRKHDKAICCSESSWNVVKESVSNSTFVRNGINFEEKKNSSIRRELGIPETAIVYMFAGNITKLKNVLLMVEMMSSYMKDNEYLLVLGDGPLLKDIRAYENTNIKVLGYKSNISDYLCASNIYVSFSTSEGLSISVIEALSNNLLVLLSNIPSHKEFFEIDGSQYIGECFCIDSFGHSLDEIRKHLPGCTRAFQEKYLSGNAMMQEYMREYRKVLE